MSTSPNRKTTTPGTNDGSFAPKSSSAPGSAAILSPKDARGGLTETRISALEQGQRVVIGDREHLVVSVDSAPDPGGWRYYDVALYDPASRTLSNHSDTSFDGQPTVQARDTLMRDDLHKAMRAREVLQAREALDVAQARVEVWTKRTRPLQARRLRREAEKAATRLREIEDGARRDGLLTA